MKSELEVLFAPDWRSGVPYQTLLATALQRYGVSVRFLEGYKRILPLRRLLAAQRCDVLHLHWPEAYFPRKGDSFDWFRSARFPLDLAGATKGTGLAATAHNFNVHNRAEERLAARNIRFVHAKAGVIFAHSAIAKQRILESFELPDVKVQVIPHGDLSVALGAPAPACKARNELGLGPGKIALVFGTVEPYKGLEEVIEWWHQASPNVKLAIIGKPATMEYRSKIEWKIGNTRNVIHRLEWLPDELLRLWLSAADVSIFNYRQIFTSGAASLARSFGIPILIPKRLDTVGLGEPSPYVRRFSNFTADFAEQLVAALAVQPNFEAASSWREACSWDNVARLTADGYRNAFN
jgi:glycosyltransferase involved in cell wall biosynthesis